MIPDEILYALTGYLISDESLEENSWTPNALHFKRATNRTAVQSNRILTVVLGMSLYTASTENRGRWTVVVTAIEARIHFPGNGKRKKWIRECQQKSNLLVVLADNQLIDKKRIIKMHNAANCKRAFCPTCGEAYVRSLIASGNARRYKRGETKIVSLTAKGRSAARASVIADTNTRLGR